MGHLGKAKKSKMKKFCERKRVVQLALTLCHVFRNKRGKNWWMEPGGLTGADNQINTHLMARIVPSPPIGGETGTHHGQITTYGHVFPSVGTLLWSDSIDFK